MTTIFNIGEEPNGDSNKNCDANTNIALEITNSAVLNQGEEVFTGQRKERNHDGES